MKYDFKEYAVVSDFDGTITCEDSNDMLVTVCGNAQNRQIENDYRGGILGSRPAMIQNFDIMRITHEGYRSFIKDYIHIDPEFNAFLQQVRKRKIMFFILSAGFRQAIQYVIGEENLNGIQVFANDLLGEEYLSPVFAKSEDVCIEDIGPCGNCKRTCIEEIRRETNRKILFIGDGLTDRCVAHNSDLVFAKNDLADYCDSKGLPYIPYKNFADIAEYLWADC